MIREATVDDKPRIIEMAARFILGTRYGEFLAVVPEKIGALVDILLEHGVILVAERDGELVGMLAMAGPFEHTLERWLYAEEVAWWVNPEHRNGTIGPRLMHHMECWCRQNSVYMVKMLAPVDSDVGDFYAKCGYQAIETAWVKVFR